MDARHGRYLGVSAVALAGTLLGCRPQPAAVELPPALVADSVDLASVRAIADSVGVQQLFARVAVPDAVLTDFFGVQPLRPYTIDQVVADFVPAHASLIDRRTHSATLEFRDGPTVRFRTDARLIVNGNEVETPYARVAIDRPSTYPAEPTLFRQIIERAGLSSRYLVPNPYHALELQVARDLAGALSIPAVEVSADTTGFGASMHAVLLVGETHGGTERYEQTLDFLAVPAVSWIALEMVPEDLQPALDGFHDSLPESSAHTAARQELLRFFSANWNTRGHEATAAPHDNPYFRLIVQAQRLGKRVIALDTRADYILFRFGEFPLGATVRDATWAANVPATGRGIVYGGSAHFNQSRRPNMLTYLRLRDSRVRVFYPPTGG